MKPTTVVSVGDTAQSVVAELAKFPQTIQVVRQCPALDELLAACQSGLAQVAVIAEFADDLTATLIDRLTAVGVSVVAVATSAEEAGRLKDIGAHPVAATISPEALVEVVRSAVEGRRHPQSAGFSVPSSSVPPRQSMPMDDAGTNSDQDGATAAVVEQMHGVMSGKLRSAAGSTSQAAEVPNRGYGMLVAVWGPIGSPGRTTLAINLAAERAAAGRTVMVIDADSYGASIAASLGLLEESASFAQACRSADQGSLTVERLARTASQVVFKGGAFSLLTGLTRADRWPELRAAAVERVLAVARESSDLVVVDCGFALENDEELSYDTVAPRRNAATLKVLAQADLVYAVGSGDPLGIPRLIRGLDELTRQIPTAEVRVVVNKVRRKSVGGSPEKSLAQAWERFGPERGINHFLPWDHELTGQALLEGRLLLELAPDAPLRRAIRGINCADDQQNPKTAVSNATARPPNHG